MQRPATRERGAELRLPRLEALAHHVLVIASTACGNEELVAADIRFDSPISALAAITGLACRASRLPTGPVNQRQITDVEGLAFPWSSGYTGACMARCSRTGRRSLGAIASMAALSSGRAVIAGFAPKNRPQLCERRSEIRAEETLL